MHWLLSFLLVTFAAASTWAAESLSGALAYRLGTGDQIGVTVFGHEDLSGTFTVNEVGTVSLPLVGNLVLRDLTIRESEEAITRALKPDYLLNPRVNVEVLNYRPFYIIGEVNAPGSYAYVNGMTVTEAVAMAGGYTYRAKEKNVLIVRAADPQRKEAPAQDTTTVLPGDVIKVPERFF